MSELVNCVFCNPNPEIIFLKNELAWARWDPSPVSDGHALFITKRHVLNFFDATQQERIAMFELIDRAKAIIDEKYNPDGYNIGVNCGELAGQTIMHLHIHLIPRYRGDVPNPRGGVRGVIPEKQNY